MSVRVRVCGGRHECMSGCVGAGMSVCVRVCCELGMSASMNIYNECEPWSGSSVG